MSEDTNGNDGKRERATPVDAKTFIEVYQTSESVAQVAERTGLAPHTVSQRASLYRNKHNIALKQMPNAGTGARNDWDELRALADSLRPEEESEDAEDDSDATDN
tara:strand:- start:210 stop:524 length:315 start_codon:yes stop_codon:yes gene_type:complete